MANTTNGQSVATEHSDQNIIFETDAVQKSYQDRMRDEKLNLSIPEEEAKKEVPKEEAKKDNSKKEVRKNSPKKEVKKDIPKEENTNDIPASEISLTEEEYYEFLVKEAMAEEWYQRNYGYAPELFEDETVKKQFRQNEKDIAEAGKLGADKEDVEDMLDANSMLGKDIFEKDKEIKEEPNPWLKRDIQKERKEVLSSMGVLGKKIQNANLAFSTKGKEVYKGLTKPIRVAARERYAKKADKLMDKADKLSLKLRNTMEKADAAALIQMRKKMLKAANKNKTLPKELQNVEIYRSIRNQKKINKLHQKINQTTIASNTQKAMIQRSFAYEAALNRKIERNKQLREDNKEILAAQPTKEERKIVKEEKSLEKTEKKTEQQQRKLTAIEKRNEVKEKHSEAKDELNELKKQVKQAKKSVFETKVEEAEFMSGEKEAEKALAKLDKNLMTGKSVIIETEQDKIRAFKELNGNLKLERWNDRREMYEDVSRVATISAFAKDQKLVTRKIDALFEGTTKPEPEKESGDRSL